MKELVGGTAAAVDCEKHSDHTRGLYLQSVMFLERVHHKLLDVIKDELDRRNRADLNSLQALLLYNIGGNDVAAGEIRTRGYYLGTNASYNIKKLADMGFLHYQRCVIDRRSVRLRLTPKGREVHDIIGSLYEKHLRSLEVVGGFNSDAFDTLNNSLRRLERFWTSQTLYRA